MLMKELKEKKRISSRLHNRLCRAFRDTPNNRKEFYAIIVGYIYNCTYIGDVHVSKEYLDHFYETLSFDKKKEIFEKYFDKMYEKYENSSLEEVLKELDIQEPEDIMQFSGLGKMSVSELQVLIERNQDESKAI